MTASTKRQRRPVVLLRPVPGTSPIHELWAGTKLLVVFTLSVLLTFFPGWVPIVGVGVLVLVAIRLARISRGVLPTIPWWLWLLLAFGALTAALGAGSPEVTIGSVELGLGGLLNFTRITLLAVVLLGLCMLVSWTTNVSDIAPAIATLGRPFKKLRLPVDDWAVATALALRSFPMLLDEFRVLYAARRLRPRPYFPRRMRLRGSVSNSSTCWRRPSRWPCAAATRWATRSPPAAARVSSPRARAGSAAATRWPSRSCSPSVRRRWRRNCS